MNITDFKGALKSGARPNLFEVQIGFLGDKVRFLAKGASIPPATIGVIDVPYMGRQIKVAGNRTFEPWTITVYNDTNFEIRKKIEQWMNDINSHEGNVGQSTIAKYYKDGQVTQFGRDGANIREYKVIDMFPTEMSEIELDFENNDQVETFTITFAYNYWTSAETS